MELKNQLSPLSELTMCRPDHHLREVAKDKAELQRALDRAIQFVDEHKEDRVSLIFLYGYIGNAYRVLNRPEEAIAILNQSLQLAMATNKCVEEVKALIRLGEAYKYANQHDQALTTFDRANQLIQFHWLYDYHDFVLQHKGKCLLEMGHYAEALPLLQQALKLRKQKGDTSLITSTEEAIKLGQQLQNKQ